MQALGIDSTDEGQSNPLAGNDLASAIISPATRPNDRQADNFGSYRGQSFTQNRLARLE